jgi:hypothetical protein
MSVRLGRIPHFFVWGGAETVLRSTISDESEGSYRALKCYFSVSFQFLLSLSKMLLGMKMNGKSTLAYTQSRKREGAGEAGEIQ